MFTSIFPPSNHKYKNQSNTLLAFQKKNKQKKASIFPISLHNHQLLRKIQHFQPQYDPKTGLKRPRFVQDRVNIPKKLPKYGYPQRRDLSSKNNWVSAAEIAIIFVKYGLARRR